MTAQPSWFPFLKAFIAADKVAKAPYDPDACYCYGDAGGPHYHPEDHSRCGGACEVVRAEVAHCVHVFIGQLDVCLACGTPNPASLR